MGLRDFLKKILDFIDAEEERNLPGNYGRLNTQLRTGCEQKGKLFEKYLIIRFDTTNYFGIITQKYHTQTIRRVRQGRIENYLWYQKEQNVLVYAVTGVGYYILWARK